jgi:hypothetical protein
MCVIVWFGLRVADVCFSANGNALFSGSDRPLAIEGVEVLFGDSGAKERNFVIVQRIVRIQGSVYFPSWKKRR